MWFFECINLHEIRIVDLCLLAGNKNNSEKMCMAHTRSNLNTIVLPYHVLLNFASHVIQSRIISKAGLTWMTRTKRDPIGVVNLSANAIRTLHLSSTIDSCICASAFF